MGTSSRAAVNRPSQALELADAGRRIVRLERDAPSLARHGLDAVRERGATAVSNPRHGILHDQVNFLQKPFARPALALKVREVLDIGGDEVVNTLKTGRTAAVAKAQAQTVAKALRTARCRSPSRCIGSWDMMVLQIGERVFSRALQVRRPAAQDVMRDASTWGALGGAVSQAAHGAGDVG